MAGYGVERWTSEAIAAACGAAHADYSSELRKRHRTLGASPDAARASAFPPQLSRIAEMLPDEAWHDAWWAAKSSQALALTQLVAAVEVDPTLSWLPLSDSLGPRRFGLFEVELAEHVLNERPRQTQLDFLAVGDQGVIAVEAKFTEKGFGPCSCERAPSGPCSARVYERPYWTTAKRDFGLNEPGTHCPLSVAYQPVRNVAAAHAISGRERASGFVLIYDDRNPFSPVPGGGRDGRSCFER